MGIDPSLLVDAGSAGPNPYLAQMQGQQGLQAGQQQLAMGALQLKATQDQQARDQQFQTVVADYFDHPAPQKLARISAMFPEKAKGLQDSYSIMDAAQLQSRKTQLGQLYSAAKNGNSALAAKQIDSIIAAEKAAGLDTTDGEAAKAAIESGDPKALTQTLAFAQMHLAAADPKFAKDIGAISDDFTLGQGDTRYHDGQVVASVAPKPDYLVVPEGGKAVPINGAPALDMGGGGQASGSTGGAPGSTTNAPRRSMGWTPRARDGGDNPDSVVDAKLAAISKATGFDPDAPLTPEQAAKVIAAIPATEGGAGSIADRNNNPGNIKFGGFARSQGATKDPHSGYAVFPTKEAGLKAAQRLGQGYYARGQRTIRDIIEGKPVGGSAAPVGPPRASGDPAGTIYGTPKPGYQVLAPNEVPPGLDPNTVYQRSPDGQITPVGGQKQGQLKPWPAPALAARVSNDAALTNITGALSLLSPSNNTKEAQAAKAAVGFGTGVLGNRFTNWNDPAGADFRARIGQIGGIIIKDTSGAAVSLSEDERLSKWVPKVDDAPDTIRSKLNNLRRELAQRNEVMDNTYTEDQGFRPLHQHEAPAATPGEGY